jgi:hypothetical protein
VPTLLLLALAGGAGAAAWQAWNHSIDTSPSLLDPPALAATAAPERSAAPSVLETATVVPSYAETIARPLFNPTRRPIVVAAPKVVAPPPPAPVVPLQAQLVGLVSGTTSGGRALLRVANDRHGAWLTVGEELRGWRIAEIKTDRVVLQSGAARQELHLQPPRTKAAKTQ